MRSKKRSHFAMARYLRFFANFAFRRWHPRVIAITGSADKTTILHMLEFELGDRAHYWHGDNSILGIPLDLLGMNSTGRSRPCWLKMVFLAPIRALSYCRSGELYVVEIDSQDPREAEFLATWLQPEVTLWTSPSDTPALPQNTQNTQNTQKYVYIDAGSSEMKSALKGSKAKVVEFDKKKLKRYNVYPTRTDFIFETTSFHFAQPQPKDIALQLLMLESLVDYLGVPLRTDFSSMPVSPGRSSYFHGKKGLNIIDSSYDADLAGTQSILEMARNLRAGHKWLVIGDITERDDADGEDHRKLANLIADANPEMAILVGRCVKEYTAPRLRELGVPARTTLDPKKALTFIEQNTTGEETLIFEGGQDLEWLIEKLLASPEDAQSLSRREPADVKRREKRGLK